MPEVSSDIYALLIAADDAAARSELGLRSASIEAASYLTVAGAGIDPTGATDSTAAIHALITAAQAAGGCGAIFFPAGTYKCNLAVTGNLKIFGAGNGDVGDWTGAGTGRTTLVPNNNANPIISVTASNGFWLQHLELRGNGAGTTTTGLKIAAPGGYFLSDITVRRCTYNLHSVAGCNFEAQHCSFLQGTRNVFLDDTGFAHSYVFYLCTVGGVPVTGDGRCYHILGGSFVTIIQGEQGNCTDYLYSSGGGQSINIIGSNWETFSATQLMTVDGLMSLAIIGGRMAVDSKVLVRTSAAPEILLESLRYGTGNIIEHNGTCRPVVRGFAGGASILEIKEYTTDFLTLVGTSLGARIRVSGRLTVERTIGGAGITTVVYNTIDLGTAHYNTTTGIFKPGRKGWYQISASLRLSTVAGGYAALTFRINDAEASVPTMLLSGGAGTTLCGSDLLYLDANDELKIAISTGGACAVQTGSNFPTKFSIVEVEP